MMKPSLALAVIFTTCALSACKPQVASERPVSPQIKQIMSQSRYATAKWGFYVKDLTDNKVIYRLNPNKMFIPASVSKLFGVSALLRTYGSDYVFQTPVYAVGKTDDKGVFSGNLVLVGKGDLTFGGRLAADGKIAYTGFDHIYAGIDCYKGEILTPQDPLFAIKFLAKQIKASGIRAVNGNILVDNRLFETVSRRGNTISPTMINENVIDVEVMPTQVGKTANIQWRPQVSQARVINQVVTGKPGEKSILSIVSNACGDQLTVSGTIAADRKKLLNVLPIQDPQKFAQNAFIDALHAEGISVYPNPTVVNALPDAKDYQSLKPVAVFVSPPLIETAKLIWKVSHNPGANMIPLLLASSQGKTSYEEGMRMIGSFVVNTVHINPNEISFLDGAGGDSNYVTCDGVIKMLDYIYHLPAKEFAKNLYALPTLGVDGSLESVARQTPARGHVFAKTGTGIIPNALQGNFFMTAESLAGYVQAKNGHWLAFMVVVNGLPMKEICDATRVNEDLGMIAAKLYEGG
jgi:serine-type D-Ala-D-Ala carboxypeptidase/endopeptidase (penicillin-binding protein 4)